MLAHREDVRRAASTTSSSAWATGLCDQEYFANFASLHMSDVTFDAGNNRMEVHHRHAEPWRCDLVDTGESTMTGGRLRRVQRIPGARPAVSASPMAMAWPTWT